MCSTAPRSDPAGLILAARSITDAQPGPAIHASADHLDHVTDEDARALAAAGVVATLVPVASLYSRLAWWLLPVASTEPQSPNTANE